MPKCCGYENPTEYGLGGKTFFPKTIILKRKRRETETENKVEEGREDKMCLSKGKEQSSSGKEEQSEHSWRKWTGCGHPRKQCRRIKFRVYLAIELWCSSQTKTTGKTLWCYKLFTFYEILFPLNPKKIAVNTEISFSDILCSHRTRNTHSLPYLFTYIVSLNPQDNFYQLNKLLFDEALKTPFLFQLSWMSDPELNYRFLNLLPDTKRWIW